MAITRRRVVMKVAIVTGNIIDGFDLHGPFDDTTEAHDWADNEFPSMDWWVIILDDPNKVNKYDHAD